MFFSKKYFVTNFKHYCLKVGFHNIIYTAIYQLINNNWSWMLREIVFYFNIKTSKHL